jgi:hypothetical protein
MRTFNNISKIFLGCGLLTMSKSPLMFFFSKIFTEFLNPVGASITLEMEENMILFTHKRSEVTDMKSHILGGHHKMKNTIRDLQRLEISRNSSQGCL